MVKNGTTLTCTLCTLGTLCVLISCSNAPERAERAQATATSPIPDLFSKVTREVSEIITKEGKSMRFERTGSGSYGPNATNVVVGEADGLEPRVRSCTEVGPPNFHRDAPFGHRFQPGLTDLKDALNRTKEILQEVSYWPRCPMTWEVRDKSGETYRYCARKKGEAAEPPKPSGCPAN
jgi:hypothetical protein